MATALPAKKKTPAPTRAVRKPIAAAKSRVVAALAPPSQPQSDVGKIKKPKLVRDSFTFPQIDYDRIGQLKKRALGAGMEVKKSELLRAGLRLLCGLSDRELAAQLKTVEKIKPGRPAKH